MRGRAECRSWVIALTAAEAEAADFVAVTRRLCARQLDPVNHLLVSRSNSMRVELMGARAEMAVSLATGQPWHTDLYTAAQAKRREPRPAGGLDVGRLAVRATEHASGGLLLQRSDDPAAVYVLAIARTERVFSLVGWLYGAEGQQSGFWDVGLPKAAYRVPQSDLRPISTLPHGNDL